MYCYVTAILNVFNIILFTVCLVRVQQWAEVTDQSMIPKLLNCICTLKATAVTCLLCFCQTRASLLAFQCHRSVLSILQQQNVASFNFFIPCGAVVDAMSLAYQYSFWLLEQCCRQKLFTSATTLKQHLLMQPDQYQLLLFSKCQLYSKMSVDFYTILGS